jgi:hypothetical protein
MAHIKVAFLKPIGIGLPGDRGHLEPRLHAHVRQVPGFSQPIPVQDYHLVDGDGATMQTQFKRDTYDLPLKPEAPRDLPASLADADPEIRKAFLVAQATEIAANHSANEELRAALQPFVERGIIEVLEDLGFTPVAKPEVSKPKKAADKAE